MFRIDQKSIETVNLPLYTNVKRIKMYTLYFEHIKLTKILDIVLNPLVCNKILVRLLIRLKGEGVFIFQMKILNPNQFMSTDQVVVSAGIPPPSFFPSKCFGPLGQNIST